MARKSSWNPVAFVPAQVTFIASAAYIALFAVLLWVHTTVPSAPTDPVPVPGVNLTEAWLDLDFISDGYHPWDSRRNGVVKAFLARRVEEILKRNEVDYKLIEQSGDAALGWRSKSGGKPQGPKAVTVFKDEASNATLVDDFRKQPWTCYAESENILVYIRGTSDDEAGDWWEGGGGYRGQGGVLVNAHYDSVASGFGATDDGVGVVTILQLISHFTTEGHQPKRGVVALLNEGEENGLFGAYNYMRHPLSQFAHTFLNLEGAGAGGRAVLFRSTDAEVTSFYSQSPRPFGNVVSGDGFKRGVVRSGTDYSVFVDSLGLRGLDVAFFEPRARYHTDQDDARDTNPDSLWHMLSASLATVEAMTSYDGDEFEGSVDRRGKLDLESGSVGVWFDLFGRAFAVIKLHTLFALSVTLLTVGPVILIILEIIITKLDRWYPLSRRQHLDAVGDHEPIHFSGLRGLFRLPIAFVIATAAVFALAYLLTKINPFIVYSSAYAVWAMMLSAWFVVAWFFLAGADRIRPTALQRMFGLVWLYALSWVTLVATTIGENNLEIAGGYFMVVYNGSVFVALLISYLELIALPTKTAYMEHVAGLDDAAERSSTRPGSRSSRTLLSQSRSRPRSSRIGEEDDDANEQTSLLRGARSRRSGGTLTGLSKQRHPDDDGSLDDADDPFLTNAYGDEQAWSSSLLQWTWIVQFVILVPINVILVGQIALLLTSALQMTPADGNPPLTIYLSVAALAALLLLPLTPFLHRLKYYVPTFLFLVLIGCLIYNLLAFPFSRDARMKFFFVQRMDLDSGVNTVQLIGLDGYVQSIVEDLPSAAGQPVDCDIKIPGQSSKSGTRRNCEWNGLRPNIELYGRAASSNLDHGATNFTSWIEYNVTHGGDWAYFSFRGRDSKICYLVFDQAVASVDIDDAAADPRLKAVADTGSTEVRLFSRTWEKTFEVNVTWPEGQEAKGQTGRVQCMWNDVNDRGVIPAYDEVMRFAPTWSVPTKQTNGLLEGFKKFAL